MTFTEVVNSFPPQVGALVYDLATIKDRPDYHPEDNVLIHVKIVFARALETGNPNFFLAAIFHDIGKKVVAEPARSPHGYNFSPDHPRFAAYVVGAFHEEIRRWGGDPFIVSQICRYHMQAHENPASLRKIKHASEILRFAELDKMI